MATIECKICAVADRIYKQGDNILLMLRLTDDDGVVVSELSGYDIDIVLSSPRSIVKRYSYTPVAEGEQDNNDISIDDQGYMAIHLPSAFTSRMVGRYSVDISLRSAGEIVIQKKALAAEFIPSTISKLKQS